jgi:hypothetical protein
MPSKDLCVIYITLFDRTQTTADAEIPRSKVTTAIPNATLRAPIARAHRLGGRPFVCRVSVSRRRGRAGRPQGGTVAKFSGSATWRRFESYPIQFKRTSYFLAHQPSG